ncbi:MAG: hypothetical protein IJ574_04485 [Bacilli bacterium]|nr:hypothetical protein [Bacilli bacterium]
MAVLLEFYLNMIKSVIIYDFVLNKYFTIFYFCYKLLKIKKFIIVTNVYSVFAIRPALYLKSTVTITGGAGTSSNPYTLGL